jgi:hypothetical protein
MAWLVVWLLRGFIIQDSSTMNTRADQILELHKDTGGEEDPA